MRILAQMVYLWKISLLLAYNGQDFKNGQEYRSVPIQDYKTTEDYEYTKTTAHGWTGTVEEPKGMFLNPDYTGPFTLPIKKLPSPEKGCDANTKFIMGIAARPNEFIHRDFIRHTWGAPAYRDCQKTKLVFLLGNSEDPVVDRHVAKEADKYQDIILLDYHESYINVSRKVYGLLRYVNDYCPNVKCILKGDSDTVMNIAGMEKLCELSPDHAPVMTGKILRNIGPIRDPKEKHYTPKFVWPDDNYPEFAAGFAYIFSGYGVASKLLDAVQTKTPYLRSENLRRLWEDTFFGGVIPKLIGMRLNDNKGFQWGGTIGFTWFENKPLILAIEAKDPVDTWDTMQENRGLFFPDYSNEKCYQMSFRKHRNYGNESIVDRINTHFRRLAEDENVETPFRNILKSELLKIVFFGKELDAIIRKYQ